MDNQWKEEKCGSCEFKINNECRRTPPSIIRKWRQTWTTSEYPPVSQETPACYLWYKKENTQ